MLGANKGKDLLSVIEIGLAIIDFAPTAPDLQVCIPIFHKRVANAYLKQGKPTAALNHFYLARDGFLAIRAQARMSNQGDWLDEIALLERARKKLS